MPDHVQEAWRYGKSHDPATQHDSQKASCWLAGAWLFAHLQGIYGLFPTCSFTIRQRRCKQKHLNRLQNAAAARMMHQSQAPSYPGLGVQHCPWNGSSLQCHHCCTSHRTNCSRPNISGHCRCKVTPRLSTAVLLSMYHFCHLCTCPALALTALD